MSIYSSGNIDISEIVTTVDVGVTRYSRFLLNCVKDLAVEGKRACDFGSGTGVIGLGLVELGASEIFFIEPYDVAYDLTVRNAESRLLKNFPWSMVKGISDIPKSYWGTFELLISNPSSLPTVNFGEVSQQFYGGGLLGLNMIEDMIDASKKLLAPGGLVGFLLTSLSDYKSVLRNLGKDFARVEVCNVVQFDFRPHYEEHQNYWEHLREEGKTFFFSSGNRRVEIVFFVIAER